MAKMAMPQGSDSRFRGNDRCFDGDPIPNDSTTRAGLSLDF
jgi:hypothetical protein